MHKIFAAMLILFALGSAARGADEPPAVALQNIIEQQLDAFAQDEEAKAYGFAAPLIQQVFPTPGQFMAMVKQGYQPVYRNSARRFGETFTTAAGQPAQKVFLTGADGRTYEATYTFERQPDGSWKISGCYLAEVPQTNA